jgi:Flp pilus assembly protein TadB
MGGLIMPEPNIVGLVRAAAASLPVGFVLLIGGFLAIAAKVIVLGAVLLVLAVLSVCAGCVLLLVTRNRAREAFRDRQE